MPIQHQRLLKTRHSGTLLFEDAPHELRIVTEDLKILRLSWNESFEVAKIIRNAVRRSGKADDPGL